MPSCRAQLTSQQFEQLIAIAKDYRQMAESRELAPGSREDKHAKNMMVLDTDLPRTFGQTGMFGRGGPNHQPMQNVLAAFDIYRPDIGYVRCGAQRGEDIQAHRQANQCPPGARNVVHYGHAAAAHGRRANVDRLLQPYREAVLPFTVQA
mgnify:CR=1 FL=1